MSDMESTDLFQTNQDKPGGLSGRSVLIGVILVAILFVGSGMFLVVLRFNSGQRLPATFVQPNGPWQVTISVNHDKTNPDRYLYLDLSFSRSSANTTNEVTTRSDEKTKQTITSRITHRDPWLAAWDDQGNFWIASESAGAVRFTYRSTTGWTWQKLEEKIPQELPQQLKPFAGS